MSLLSDRLTDFPVQCPCDTCLRYLLSYMYDNPVQDTLQDIPAHDILDTAIYLDSPILRDRWLQIIDQYDTTHSPNNNISPT